MATTVAIYTNLPGIMGGPLSLRRSGQSRFALPDLQGNVRQLTDSTQAVTDTLTTDAFGVQKASSGSTVNPYKAFGGWGYFTDTPSRLYVRLRHLKVDLGGWMSRDPAKIARQSPYLYAGNNPLSYVDPTGALQWVSYDFDTWKIGTRAICCGEYDARWIVGFDHNRSKQNQYGNAPCTGYVIQKVSYFIDEVGCPSGSPGPNHKQYCFYEVVGERQGFSGEINKGESPYPNIADKAYYSGDRDNAGSVSSEGYAQLFCNVKASDLTNWGFTNDCLHDPSQGTNLCKACTIGAPDQGWWIIHNPGKPPEKPTRRNANSVWNCCDDCRPNWYSISYAYPPADRSTKPCG